MAFDPSIILGYRGVEIPNQLAQYAQMAQVENAQQQNALAQFQLGAARRAEQGQTALGQAYGEFYGGGGSMGAGAPPRAADLTAAYGGGGAVMGGAPRGELPYADMRQAIVNKLRTTAPNLIPAELARINEMEQKALLAKKTQTEIDTAGLTQQKTRQELVTTRTAQFRDQLNKVNSPEAAAQWTIAMYNDPQLKDTISSVPLEAALAEIPTTPQEFNLWKNQNALGMTEFIKQNKPTTQVIDQSGQKQMFQTPGLGGTPRSVGTFADVPLPANVEEQKGRLAKLGAAQTMTTINAFAPASVEAQKQFVQAASDERKVLRNAPDTLTNIEAAKKLIPTASTFMGKGGEPLLAAASFLNNRLGFGISTQGVTDATVLRTRLFEGILDNLKKLDSQPSQEQQRVLSEALGNLGTDPAALEQILNRIGETVRSRVDRFNTDVTDAEARGVKFPFTPQIKLPAPKFAPGAAAAQIPGQGPAPAPAIPPAAIDLLKSGKGTDAQFDAIFGAGAAKRARGGN